MTISFIEIKVVIEMWGRPKLVIEKNNLKRLYEKEKHSIIDIAKIYHSCPTTIYNRLLKFGLKIRNKGNLKIIKIQKHLSVEKAYMLGVLCGDGYICKSKNDTYTIGLNTIDSDFAKRFQLNMYKVYGIIAKICKLYPKQTEIRGKFYNRKPITYVRVISKNVYEDLINYGTFKTTSWTVPKEIMESSNEKIICSFLKGFVDSEGTSEEYCLEISSSNKNGLNDIKVLLSRVGIKRFYFYKDWKNVWRLIFSGKDNLLIFYEKISFSIRRKMEKLSKSIEYKLKVKNFKKDDYWETMKLRKQGYTYQNNSDK